MQFGFGIGPDTSWMRKELTDIGVKELTTPEEVTEVMEKTASGSMLLVINSVCGCAAGNARPAVKIALENDKKPEHIYTVFAGQDREATAKAREFLADFPPSSPSFAFFKDGEVKAMIPRHRVEGRSATEVADDLTMIFNAFCE
ncbi:MAG: BrxA/BrxB family bacilliredoxin [Balneolales bacterium]|nr:BrxA/BrxB family bacilliredoxin [Balneolales bacterium]